MNLKLTGLVLGTIMAMGSGALEAQENWLNKLSASASFGLGTDNLHSVTNNGAYSLSTYNVDFGYTGKISGTDIPIRFSLGYNMSPAGSKDEVYFDKRSLAGIQLASDIFFDSRIVDNLKFFVGMSLNKWTISEKISEYYDYETDEHKSSDKTVSIPGTKFGGRVGLDYKISSKLAINALFQFIEIGHFDPTLGLPTDPKQELGERPLNASWLQFGVKYSF